MRQCQFLVILLSTFVLTAQGNAAPKGLGLLTAGDQHHDLYGLEGVPFDRLTQILERKAQSKGDSNESQREFAKGRLLNETRVGVIFDQLLQLIESQTLETEEEYYQLARTIGQWREEYRLGGTFGDVKTFRNVLFLLQMVKEELLYVGYQKFNKQPLSEPTASGSAKSWSLTPNQDGISASEESLPLRSLRVKNGDVLLSKASGSGSSSFIALTGNSPHIYSHAAIAILRDGPSGKELVSPEAEITDGVKLRRMQDYKEGAKTRLSVYRLRDLTADRVQRLKGATEHFVEEMFRRVADPYSQKAYDYDFQLNPETVGAYYCVAVPHKIYEISGLEEAANPYPKVFWGDPLEIRRTIYDFLDLPRKPSAAPGDLESNREFVLVGEEIQLHRLEAERMELALIDSMFELLTERRDLVERFVEKTKEIGDEPLTPEQLDFLVKRGILPAAALDKIPAKIKPRQLIFFAYLNEVFTPQVRARLSEELLKQKASGRFVGPQELRRLASEVQRSRVEKLREGVENLLGAIKDSRNPQIVRCVSSLRTK